MATQDDINNLTSQINEEEQSATILESEIAKERQDSDQKIAGWQQQIDRHRDSVKRMHQELDSKQRDLIREQEKAAAEEKMHRERTKEIAKGVAHGLL